MSMSREEENQITRIMGSYLLKGYTLLDTHCRNCQTPLMKTKASNDYCIYCNEVAIDSKIVKKPKNTRIESKLLSKKTDNNSSNESNVCAMIEDIRDEDISKTRHQNELNSDSNTNRVEFREDMRRTVNAVHKKINWATDRLNSCDQITDCLHLINFLKSSADLLLTLNQLTPNQ